MMPDEKHDIETVKRIAGEYTGDVRRKLSEPVMSCDKNIFAL
jgi:hypothetical protein